MQIDNDITMERRRSKVNKANGSGSQTPSSRKPKAHVNPPAYVHQLVEHVRRLDGEVGLILKQLAIMPDLHVHVKIVVT
jgi:hypothetical protein